VRRTPTLIVGGGPAGAAAAIVLARAGAPHLLIERTRETGDALCGGFLSWRTLAALERLGVASDDLNPASISRVRLFVGDRTTEAPLPAPAKGVSRHRLDTLLLKRAIDDGAAVERGVAVRAIDDEVRLDDGSSIAADALFLASGKHDVRGLVRPAAARGNDPALGLRVRLGPAPGLTRLVGDAIELHAFDRGYAGLDLQEDGAGNLCMAVHRSRLHEAGDPEKLLAELGRDHPRLGERLAYRNGGGLDAVANVPYGWRATEGVAGLFRLGDQAGVIPSLAGEGMGIAIASGVSAAAARIGGGDGADWQRAFGRRIARPIAVAGVIRMLAENRAAAPLLLAAARLFPPLVGISASATRIPHEIA
jgi:menaquinone-9 beta-reductase